MKWVRVHCRVVLLLAAVLLASQPLLVLVTQSLKLDSAAASPFGGPLVICTAKGAVVIGDQGSLPKPSKHEPDCPCCSLGCLAGCSTTPTIVPFSSETFIAHFPREVGVIASRCDDVVPDTRPSSFSPRGPPSIAV